MRSFSQDRHGHSRDHVEEGCKRTQYKTKRQDFPQKERDTVYDAPLHTDLGGASHGLGPGQHPQYTRADFGQEAVGGSTTTTRTRKRRRTRVLNTET